MKSIDDLNRELSDAIDDAIDQSEEAFAIYGDQWSARHKLHCARTMAVWDRAKRALGLAEFIAARKESARQAKRLKRSLADRRSNR